jgi:hypothetical protein
MKQNKESITFICGVVTKLILTDINNIDALLTNDRLLKLKFISDHVHSNAFKSYGTSKLVEDTANESLKEAARKIIDKKIFYAFSPGDYQNWKKEKLTLDIKVLKNLNISGMSVSDIMTSDRISFLWITSIMGKDYWNAVYTEMCEKNL